MIRKLIVIATVMMLVSSAFASNGTQIGTVGARSTAMGSNFRGLADDWSAVYFNPAGLTQLEGKWSIGISTGLIAPRGSYQAMQYPAQNIPFTGLITTEVDASDRNFLVPAMGIFYKVSEKMTLGLGVYAPFGLGTEWNLVELPAGYGNTLEFENENYSDHQVINVQPTIAFKLSDKVSLGLGVSYIWGKMDLRMAKSLANPLLAEPFDGAGVSTYQYFQSLGIPIPDLTADQMRLVVENDLAGTGSAFGFNFGLLFDLTEKLSLGVSGRYSTDLKLSGTNTMYTHLLGDAVIAGTLQAAGQLEAAAVFSGATLEEDSNIDADLPLPMTIGGGFAYKATDKLTITGDVSWTNWASWDIITVEDEGGDNKEMVQNWVNTFEMGIGFECQAAENFFVRGGWYTVGTPAPDETMSPTLLDPNRRHAITAGVGLNVGNLAFNLCAEYVYFADNEIDTYHFDDMLIADNYAGAYKFNAIVVTFGTTITL